MRTLSAQEAVVLDRVDGYQAQLRVQVKSSGGSWQDLTTLGGFDWVRGVSWDESVDQPVASASVRLAKRHYDISLAPLFGASKLNAGSPAIDINREIKIEAAIIPIGTTVGAGDWKTFFHGYAGLIEMAGSHMEINARDLGYKLQRTFIEEQRSYGAAGGTDVRTIMQDILDDNGLSSVVLYTPVDPVWSVKTYPQQKQSVMEALQFLAKQRGWEVGYRWRAGTAQFELTFFEPDRAKTTPDYDMKPSRYLSIDQLALDPEDVRNVIHVVYSDRDSLDPNGNPSRNEVTVSDATSITRNGRLWCEFAFGTTDNIDSSSEATNMADAALADMKEPTATQSATCHFFPHLELGDLLRWKANGEHYDADQDLAVTTIRHTWEPPDDSGSFKARTTVGVRGKPSGNRQVWLAMTAAPGVAPSQPMIGPDAPTGLTLTKTTSGLLAKFVPPVTGRWDMFELHLSETASFTPDATTFKASSSSDQITAPDLVPGRTYYAQVVPLDLAGNRGTPSAEVSLAAGYTTPQALQPLITYSNLVPNPDFEANNTPSAPPDCWLVTPGSDFVWGTNILLDSTEVYSGAYSIKVVSGTFSDDNQFRSQYFVVRGGDRQEFSVAFRCGSTNLEGQVFVSFVDETFATVSQAAIDLDADASNTWQVSKVVVAVPLSARYARITFITDSSSDVYLDHVRLQPAEVAQEDWIAPTLGNSWVDYGGVTLGAAYMKDSAGFVNLRGTIKSGTLTAVAFTLPAGYRPGGRMHFPCVSNNLYGLGYVDANGDVTPFSASNVSFDLGTIRFKAEN